MTTHTLGKWTTATYVGTSPSGKTDLWEIQSVANGEFLGMIRWYARWRQYVFHPAKQTIWNPDCLDEVSTFCRGRTKASTEARTVGHSA